MSNKPVSFSTLDDFHKSCKVRVAQDNKEFGINSIYLPNPIFTEKPRYCLIAMEPTIRRYRTEEFQKSVDDGFKNFLDAEADFIFHYCAYHFLCGGSYDYYITDLTKGAMSIVDANINSEDRYKKWRGILKEELKFFCAPPVPVIAIGKNVDRFLIMNSIHVDCKIMHFSPCNNGRLYNYFDKHEKKSITTDLNIKLKNFSGNILEKMKYSDKLTKDIMNRIFINELNQSNKGRFLYYKDRFECLINKFTSQH